MSGVDLAWPEGETYTHPHKHTIEIGVAKGGWYQQLQLITTPIPLNLDTQTQCHRRNICLFTHQLSTRLNFLNNSFARFLGLNGIVYFAMKSSRT